MIEIIMNALMEHLDLTILGAFTLIQVSPIKINPWSWIAKLLHGFLFAEIDKKLDMISTKCDRLEKQSCEEKAMQARTHILRFADELYNGSKHSKEYFDEMLCDCDRYQKYCDDHPNFQNSKTVMSTKLIKETYSRLMEEHKFL